MFYELTETKQFDGTGEYLDISNKLHYFLKAGALSADIRFCTEDPGYQTILALYFKEALLPNFSIGMAKGRVMVSIKRGGTLKLLQSKSAYCDGSAHLLSFRGSESGVSVLLDGEVVIRDDQIGPWCEFGYVGFATIGRGTLQDHYADFFHGEIYMVRLSDRQEPLPESSHMTRREKIPLFEKGMMGVENFRIPTIMTLKGGVTIASADARMEAPGDNPNHICRAIRISRDSGETWEEPKIIVDFGGEGREDGASAIDASLLYDEDENILFMLYSHTPAGVGSALSQSGTGFDERGRRLLWDKEGREFFVEKDGHITDLAGADTGFAVDAYGRLFQGGEACGSIAHGRDRIFCELDTSFLQVIESRDCGETWSVPRDLNPEVKQDWMRFIGAGPGTGIQLRYGPHKGRLVYPVYFTGDTKTITSSGAIYSDDHGRTWRRGLSVNDGRSFEGEVLDSRSLSDPRTSLGECQLTERPDGTLKIFLRNALGKRTLTAVSTDGGESWGKLCADDALPDPQCQSHILRVRCQDRDAWLFSNPANEESRVRGVVRLSTDGAESWAASRLLEPGEFGYSCMTQLPDGQIGILYEGAEITQMFTKFPLEWLLEEK